LQLTCKYITIGYATFIKIHVIHGVIQFKQIQIDYDVIGDFLVTFGEFYDEIKDVK